MPALLKSTPFAVFWASQSASVLGNAVVLMSVPTFAVLTLSSNPVELAALEAVPAAALPILAPLAGVYADRLGPRKLMIMADFGRAAALALMLTMSAMHAISYSTLLAIATAVAVCGVTFDAAYQAFVPTIVDQQSLLKASARLELSASMSRMAGFSLSGAFIQLFTAIGGVFASAVSFVASAILLLLVRVEPGKDSARVAVPVHHALLKSAIYVWHQPALRGLALGTAAINAGASMLLAVYFIFVYRNLQLSAGTVGGILGFANLGLVAALLAEAISNRLGRFTTICLAAIAVAVSTGLSAIAAILWPVPILIASEALGTFATVLFSVTQFSSRQALILDESRGAVNALLKAVAWAPTPVFSMAAGLLASRMGVLTTILGAAALQGIGALTVLATTGNLDRVAPAGGEVGASPRDTP